MAGLELVDFEKKTREAVQAFWGNREMARKKQIEAGRVDQGERSSVTGGKNMDGFRTIIVDLVHSNGLPDAEILFNKRVITLPGYFRPTKQWDTLIIYRKQLIAALELKSHIGPSFGNNFNNRTEEAIGSSLDFWTAYREGAFGKDAPKPFLGWLMLLEDSERSRNAVRDASPHFPVFKEFIGASYAKRYNVLCSKLTKENLYSAAALIVSPKSAASSAKFKEVSKLTGMRAFVTRFAGHIASEAARLHK